MRTQKEISGFRFTQMLFMFVMVMAMYGCAMLTPKPMALTDESNALDLQKESVAILTVWTSNQYKPGYQPDISRIIVFNQDGKEKNEYIFGDKVGVLVPYDKDEKKFNEYLVSIALPAGKYKLGRIFGFGGAFPIRGNFSIPVFSDFELAPNKIVYLGRIEATLRERKSDSELRAGSVIPLIDQATTGFYSGTFDISIYDNYDKDISLFKQKYPLLNNFTVEKAVLPPWRQPTEEEMDR